MHRGGTAYLSPTRASLLAAHESCRPGVAFVCPVEVAREPLAVNLYGCFTRALGAAVKSGGRTVNRRETPNSERPSWFYEATVSRVRESRRAWRPTGWRANRRLSLTRDTTFRPGLSVGFGQNVRILRAFRPSFAAQFVASVRERRDTIARARNTAATSSGGRNDSSFDYEARQRSETPPYEDAPPHG
jgi:hypothetical protein